jgi:hypothetical protein
VVVAVVVVVLVLVLVVVVVLVTVVVVVVVVVLLVVMVVVLAVAAAVVSGSPRAAPLSLGVLQLLASVAAQGGCPLSCHALQLPPLPPTLARWLGAWFLASSPRCIAFPRPLLP